MLEGAISLVSSICKVKPALARATASFRRVWHNMLSVVVTVLWTKWTSWRWTSVLILIRYMSCHDSHGAWKFREELPLLCVQFIVSGLPQQLSDSCIIFVSRAYRLCQGGALWQMLILMGGKAHGGVHKRADGSLEIHRFTLKIYCVWGKVGRT